MSALRDIVTAVSSGSDGFTALKFNKGAHATGEGDRYEERVLALVFLRCLKQRLIFQLSANNGDAGKFDDVVLVWRPEGHPEARILCVQLKHKKSAAIQSAHLLSEASNSDFGLRKYCTSYDEISKQLEMDRVTLVLMTNACLGDSSLDMFEPQDVGNVPGLELLQVGGRCGKLNPNNQWVCEAVRGNTSFVEHFYLLWKQNDCEWLVSDICNELEELLGAGDVCRSISDSLCKWIREWMNWRKGVCLTRNWGKWQVLVDEYIKKEVTECSKVTTRLKYCNVADVWDYVESHNPAWVRPPERGVEALSATKIHQALTGKTHIMVTVQQFREMRQRILRCWGPYCQWLVVVNDGREDNCDIFYELMAQLHTERHLVIVSSRESNSFTDTCKSSDISDDSWNEFLDVRVRLNGERYECRLHDLVAGVDVLKSLLDNQPSLLLALARLSPPLRMGQELETLPEHYVSRKLADRWLVTDEFFSSLGPKDVCVTDSASCEPLKRETGSDSVMSLEGFRSWCFKPYLIEWPLIVLIDNLESVREECKCLGGLNIYLLQRSGERWRILSLSGGTDRIRGYKKEEEVEQLEALDSAKNVVIVEGRPGVGKSKMLSHVAKQVKERDPTCWVLRVNLLEFYTALDNNDSCVRAVEDIFKETVFNKDQLGRLEYALLCHNLLHSPTAICLVDGFDEVCPDYVNKCLEVLSLLTLRRGKLVVTTRPAVVRLLETRMGVLAHALKPFSKSELEDFFRHHPLSGNIPSVSGLNQSLRNLLRIPLFAEMFAKLSQEKADTYDIVTLYEAFFQNNFRRLYKEKWRDNFSTPGKKREIEEAQKKHEEQLMLLAASVLLHSKVLLANPTLDTDYFVKSGIVYEFVNRKPAFLHRTFAEHFLAKWCFLSDGEKKRGAVYRKAYVKKRLEFFLESFDRRAARNHPLLEAVIDGDEGKLKELLEGGANPGETDACGRNALHLAAAYSMQHPPSLLRLLCKSAKVATLSAKDSLLGWTPMRYAAEGRCWAAVNVMLEEGGHREQLGDFRARLHDPAKLRAIFQRDGYLALWRHVLWLNRQSRKAKASWQGVGTQTQFALSLISTNVSREWLRVIAEEARKKGHHTVWSIILRGNMRRAGKEISLSGIVKKRKPKYGRRYPSRYPKVTKCTLGESTPGYFTEVTEGVSPPHAVAGVVSPASTIGCSQTGLWHMCSEDEADGDTYSVVHNRAAACGSDNDRAVINIYWGRSVGEREACPDSSPARHHVLQNGMRLTVRTGGRRRAGKTWRRLDSLGMRRKRRRRGKHDLGIVLSRGSVVDSQDMPPTVRATATFSDNVTVDELLLALATYNPFSITTCVQ